MDALAGRWVSAAAAGTLAGIAQAVSVCIPECRDGRYRFPVLACTVGQESMRSRPVHTALPNCRNSSCSSVCYRCT